MRKPYKEMIRQLLSDNGIEVYNFGSLPDSKTVSTKSSIGFHGTMCAKTWYQLYKRVMKELED